MKINAIGNIPPISDYVKTVADRHNSINKINKTNSLNHNESLKSASQDQKNNFVISKSERDSNNPEFYLRYYANVPLSKPEISSRTFNDIKKLNPPKKENDTSEFYTVIDDEENKNESLEKAGLYYVVSGKDEVLNYWVIKDHFDMFREKLLKTYHINEGKEAGTLVNLVF
jgi:hypothetical protein